MTVLPAVATPLEDLLAELSRTLWKQRGLIELLAYRLEVQQLICVAGAADRLGFAVEEVESAMDDIRRSERTRDSVVRQCAAVLGLPDSASLADLREQVGAPWHDMLAEHQAALLSLVSATEELAAMNRELAVRGANDSRTLLDAITGQRPATAYGPATSGAGAGSRGLVPPTLVDRTA